MSIAGFIYPLPVLGFVVIQICELAQFLQVSIPLGLHDNLPVSISLLARHGSDGFLLNLVETLYDSLKDEIAVLRE